MIRLATYPAEAIIPLIGTGKSKIKLDVGSVTYTVRVNSPRLECLRRNQTCVWCKRKGTIFVLEAHQIGTPRVTTHCFIDDCPWCNRYHAQPEPGKMDAPHLNLYARDRKGTLILMTQDHIYPRSHGGSNKIENLQTMCRCCNSSKGSALPHEVEAGVYMGKILNRPGPKNENHLSGH